VKENKVGSQAKAAKHCQALQCAPERGSLVTAAGILFSQLYIC